MPISPISVAYATAGGLLIYSGVTGDTIGNSVRTVLKGQQPTGKTTAANTSSLWITNATPAVSLSGMSAPAGNTGAANVSAAANQATARLLAVSLGHPTWIAGQQWQDWLSLWNQESSWQDEANPKSSARGIAQNIAGYGPGYQQGNLPQQITWGISYISQRYGSPSSAWAHEVADGWY